ncbi:MAG: glycosyltransferase [Pseudomonadota bacterium]|nr:glycosyltransferase [Pseudomonadota bacterium]
MLRTNEVKLPLRIILVGQTFAESRTIQRAAAMRSLGHLVNCVPTVLPGLNYETEPTTFQRIRYRLRIPGDPAGANKGILRKISNGADILWLDAADMIKPSILCRARQLNRNLAVVWYSEDDMMNPVLRTRQIEGILPLCDLWVTTKSFNAHLEELPSLGVRNVFFVNNSCEPTLHRPVKITEQERLQFGSPISFIGSFEEPRAISILHLAKSGFNVRVWGNGWSDWVGRHPNLRIENRPAYNDEFAKVISASSINLCFLREANRDLQTCRSVEIPACSGFMVHQRNSEIVEIYREEKEAIYFSSNDELVHVCSLWIDQDQQRTSIGEASRRRTMELDLTHKANIERIINSLDSIGIGQG